MSRRWLVDGSNVVGSVPDGWWRDRPAACARLVDQLQALAEAGDEVTVVFDGRPPPGLAEGDHGGVAVRWAGHADDLVAGLAAGDADPGSLTVVTSDRQLAGRVAATGSAVTGAGSFRHDVLSP